MGKKHRIFGKMLREKRLAEGYSLRTFAKLVAVSPTADLAHQWLGHAPVYAVRTLAAAPREEKDWDGVATASLVQGNYGATPDLATRVAVVRHGDLPLLVHRLAEAHRCVIDVVGSDDLHRNCIGRLRYQFKATDAGLIDRFSLVAQQDGFV